MSSVQTSTLEIAKSFVDLVLDTRLPELRTLHNIDSSIIFNVLIAAGFHPSHLTIGKLKGSSHLNSWNERLPFFVQSSSGKDYAATNFLDLVTDHIVTKTTKDNREGIVQQVEDFIKKSVPFVPIKLTVDDECITHVPDLYKGAFTVHRSDSDTIPHSDDRGFCIAGSHACGGVFEKRKTSEKSEVIFCQKCYLRVVFPSTVKTYGDLRMHMKQTLG